MCLRVKIIQTQNNVCYCGIHIREARYLIHSLMSAWSFLFCCIIFSFGWVLSATAHLLRTRFESSSIPLASHPPFIACWPSVVGAARTVTVTRRSSRFCHLFAALIKSQIKWNVGNDVSIIHTFILLPYTPGILNLNKIPFLCFYGSE